MNNKMPENKNTGRYKKDSDIDAYLDSLSPKTPKNKDINVLNEEVFVKKPTTPPFSQQRTIEKRPSVQSQVGRSINQQQVNRQRASSQGVQSRNSVNNTPQRRPAPPRYKENGKFVDAEERKKQSSNPVLRWFYNLSKGNQRLVKVFSGFLIFVIIISSALGIFIDNKFDRLGNVENYEDVIYEENLENIEDINGDINASNFKDALKLWATTGNDQKMTSKNVVNVLLIGADSRKGTNTGNTDAMLLVSLNKKTKQIKLVSFMRDSYLYIEGKNNSYCSKLNAAFSMGGPETLMKTIENNYKIEIDNFVMVNFESFKSIIEAMDGVTVDVKKYEANYANNRYKLSMPYGDGVTLNSEEALAFCRIRGCDADGDISRTRRQRSVINAIINRVTSASVSDLNKYLNVLLPYVYTGFSKSEILSLGMKAITNGWAFYDRSELQIPTNNTCQSGSMGTWIWVVDYQQAAQILQNELYGTSNITLEDGRTTLIDVYNGTTGSGSSSSSDSSKPLEKEEVSTTVKTTLPEDILEEEMTEDMGAPETEEFEELEETTTEEFEDFEEEVEEDEIEDTTLVTIGDDQ
ncbi:MAG: LCP family protein [Clostridia bacterium]|nr:LCP family protein [Clostridia bacterium]